MVILVWQKAEFAEKTGGAVKCAFLTISAWLWAGPEIVRLSVASKFTSFFSFK